MKEKMNEYNGRQKEKEEEKKDIKRRSTKTDKRKTDADRQRIFGRIKRKE